MAKPKKRMNKNAKAAQKIVEASKLLSIAKAASDARTVDHFKPTDVLHRPSPANKARPQKKRG